MDNPYHFPSKGKGRAVGSPTPSPQHSDANDHAQNSNSNPYNDRDQEDADMFDILSHSFSHTTISSSKTVRANYASPSIYSQPHGSDSGYGGSRDDGIFNAYPVSASTTSNSGSITPTGPTRDDRASSRSGSTTPTGPPSLRPPPRDINRNPGYANSLDAEEPAWPYIRRPEDCGMVHPAFRPDPFSVENERSTTPTTAIRIPVSTAAAGKDENETSLRRRLSSMFVFGAGAKDGAPKRKSSIFMFGSRKDSAAAAPAVDAASTTAIYGDAAENGKKRRMERIRNSVVEIPRKVRKLIGKKRSRDDAADDADDQEEDHDMQPRPSKAPTLARTASSVSTAILIRTEPDAAAEHNDDAFSFVDEPEIPNNLSPRPSILSFTSWETADVRGAVNIASIADIGVLRSALVRPRTPSPRPLPPPPPPPSPPPPPDFTWAGDERESFEMFLDAAENF